MKKRKTFSTLMILLGLLVWVSSAHADEITTPATPGKNSTAQANVDFQYMVESKVNSTEAPNFIQPGSQLPMINTAFAYWNCDGSDGLPENLFKQGWRIYRGENWNVNEISIDEIDNLKSPWYNPFSWFKVISTSTGIEPVEKSEDYLQLLEYWPKDKGVQKVSEAQILVEKGSELPDTTLANVINAAWKKGEHAKPYTILYKITPISNTGGDMLGGSGAGGMAHGPEGAVGNRVTSGGLGLGFGTTRAWVWNGQDMMAIGWNKKGTPPKPPVVPEVSQKIPGPIGQVIAKTPEFVQAPELRFDFNSDRIYKPEQLAVVVKHVKILAEKIRHLGPRQKIMIIGGCSNEGTDDYNSALGNRRGQAEMNMIKKALKQAYQIPESLIDDKIIHASIGEFFPDYQGGEKDRRTFLAVIDLL